MQQLDAIEKEAETIDEALQYILEELEADIEDIEYEVLEEGNTEDSDEAAVIVRGWFKNPDEFALSRDTLSQILESLELDAELEVTYTRSENTIYINILSEDAGILIGRQGQTLDALQYLIQLVINSKDINVVLDVAGYRDRHRSHLVSVADKMAERVLRQRRRITLRPMDARDRKIIHEAVKPYPELSSSSVGVEPNRRVVISLKRADYSSRSSRSSGGGGGGGGRYGGNRYGGNRYNSGNRHYSN